VAVVWINFTVKINDLIGSGSQDLQAFSIAPQPCTIQLPLQVINSTIKHLNYVYPRDLYKRNKM
jgi:hypothetical protein